MKGRIILPLFLGILVFALGSEASLAPTHESIAKSKPTASTLRGVSPVKRASIQEINPSHILKPRTPQQTPYGNIAPGMSSRTPYLVQKAKKPYAMVNPLQKYIQLPSPIRSKKTNQVTRGTRHLQVQRNDEVESTHDHAPYLASLTETREDILAVLQQDDIRPEHKALTTRLLQNLAPDCIDNLRYVYFEYGDSEHRGLAGDHTFMVNANRPLNELEGLIIHEFAHTVHLGCFEGTKNSGNSEFKDGRKHIYNNNRAIDFMRISFQDENTHHPSTVNADFVTGYAASDVYEEFAETFTYYVTQYDAFAFRAQYNHALYAKLQWMEANFPHLKQNALARGKDTGESIPWDSTKTNFQLYL